MRTNLSVAGLFLMLGLAALPAAAAVQAKSVIAQGDRLAMEIAKMMEVLGWPRMIDGALARGDLQRAVTVRAKGATRAQLNCIDRAYTRERVLPHIAAGYQQLYSDPRIVADITRFVGSPGSRKILDKISAQAMSSGARAAHEQNKDAAFAMLSAEEARTFAGFAASPAGKAYLSSRPAQQKIHQHRLAMLAHEVSNECLGKPVGAGTD